MRRAAGPWDEVDGADLGNRRQAPAARRRAAAVPARALGPALASFACSAPRPPPALPALDRLRIAGAGAFAALTDGGRSRARRTAARRADRHLLVAAGFGINEIWLSGHRYTMDSDLFAALELERAGSLLRFDPRQARDRMEQLSWVEYGCRHARLPRSAPHRGARAHPFAIWMHHGRMRSSMRPAACSPMWRRASESDSAAHPRRSGAGRRRRAVRRAAAVIPRSPARSRSPIASASAAGRCDLSPCRPCCCRPKARPTPSIAWPDLQMQPGSARWASSLPTSICGRRIAIAAPACWRRQRPGRRRRAGAADGPVEAPHA